MDRLSLSTKILLLVAGTVLGLTALVVIAVTILAGQEMERQVRLDVRSTGNILAQITRARSESLRNQTRLLADQPALKGYFQQADAATFADFAEDWRKQLHADGLLLTDRDGRALGASGTKITFREDLAGEPGVAAALNEGEWAGVVSRQGEMLLAVTVPVKIGPEVWGTLTAYSRMDSTFASELKQEVSGSDVAFVAQGRVAGASLSLPPAISTSERVPRPVVFAGRRFIALYAPLPNTPRSSGLGYVVLRPAEATLALSPRFRAMLSLLLGLMLTVALVAGTLVARSITSPLDSVVKAARILREGAWPERFEQPRNDEIGLLQSTFNEMTAAMRADQERLLALIDTDPLTGLDNHRRFQERLPQEVRRSALSGESLTMLLFDFDNFQQYNQQYGHAAGDERLREFGSLLETHLPEVAVAARFGGEEFAVLLPQHDLEAAEPIAEQIKTQFCTQEQPNGSETHLTLSVGCAEISVEVAEADSLVMATELAVAQAKQLGRNRVCRFDSVPGAGQSSDPYQLHRFLKDGSLATIQALAAAVDAKDPYTQGHSQRVAEYASALAERIGLSRTEVELVYTTGTLHDVGKIGVPDSILKKPGRLEPEERAIMETHPALGEVIIRKAPQLALTLPGVRHHHERWDGNGYPDRLSGTEIPLIGRLLALADTFDAMTSDRPYRKGMAPETALAEFPKLAGSQFDPDLTTEFVQMMSRSEMKKAA